MKKFNNLKVERLKSNLKYTELKLVKKRQRQKEEMLKNHYHVGKV